MNEVRNIITTLHAPNHELNGFPRQPKLLAIIKYIHINLYLNRSIESHRLLCSLTVIQNLCCSVNFTRIRG